MSPKFLANQLQNDITLLMKKLVTIGAKVPTTPEGGNHGHTNTITPQPSKTPLHTAETRMENSSQVTNNTQTQGWKPPSHRNQSKHYQTQRNQGWKTPVK
jgi:hypothetical protein